MKFVFHASEDLPKLSWCAVLHKEQSDIHIYHGPAVETSDGLFVEGVWDGDFDQFGFDKAELFCGSGGKLINDNSGAAGSEKVLFASPNHVLERLCSITCDDKIFISNSMPFALSLSCSDLDAQYHQYLEDLCSIHKGINGYVHTIPLKDSRRMDLHYFCNIIIDKELKLHTEKKLPAPPLTSYLDYYQNMLNLLERINKNALADHRKIKYGKVTTISKGYDAVACAVMARKIGCNTAVTFNRPEKYTNDSGEDIATLLGYENVIMKNANEYRENESLVEAEYVASGELGTEIIFSAFDKEFADNIVFFGNRGDVFWNRHRGDYNDEFRFKADYNYQTSHIEGRLRVGYVMLPLPFFRATQWAAINKISNSPEMADYFSGNKYDRPIPRRIIEESGGIPRDMFALAKYGAGFTYSFDNLSRIKQKMSPVSYNSFVNYYKTHKRKGLRSIYYWSLYLKETTPHYINYFLEKTGLKFRFKYSGVFNTFNPGAPSYLFNWGIEEMKKRYQKVSLNGK